MLVFAMLYLVANGWFESTECLFSDYSDLYLKSDVFLLADVFENFREMCMQSYNLDPAYYFTTPAYSFDAMLKQTAIKLELLTDYDML